MEDRLSKGRKALTKDTKHLVNMPASFWNYLETWTVLSERLLKIPWRQIEINFKITDGNSELKFKVI